MSLFVLLIATLHAIPVILTGIFSNNEENIGIVAFLTAVTALITGAIIFAPIDWLFVFVGYKLAHAIHERKIKLILSNALEKNIIEVNPFVNARTFAELSQSLKKLCNYLIDIVRKIIIFL